MFEQDCRDKLTPADGSTCVFMKCRAFAHLPRFDLYDASEALLVQCRMVGMLYRHLRFTDAGGRELATIRFKWSLPVLQLPDGATIELAFFRQLGTDFLPNATVEIRGARLNCAGGDFSLCGDFEADKHALLKAILCFCLLYPRARKKDLERAALCLLFLGASMVVLSMCYILFKM